MFPVGEHVCWSTRCDALVSDHHNFCFNCGVEQPAYLIRRYQKDIETVVEAIRSNSFLYASPLDYSGPYARLVDRILRLLIFLKLIATNRHMGRKRVQLAAGNSVAEIIQKLRFYQTTLGPLEFKKGRLKLLDHLEIDGTADFLPLYEDIFGSLVENIPEDVYQRVVWALEQIAENRAQAIIQVYDLDSKGTRTLKSIGEEMNVTGSYIRGLSDSGIRDLRRYSIARVLRGQKEIPDKTR